MRGLGFDLVLMDMVMPVMDGIEATTMMRASADARTRQMPVLGLTANVNAHDLARFEQAGLNGLLLKPFEQSQLVEQMDRLLQLGQPEDAADFVKGGAS